MTDFLDGHASDSMSIVNLETVQRALEAARHELTSLHGLIAFDAQAPGERWVITTNKTVDAIDQALGVLGSLRRTLENLVGAFERFDRALSTADTREKEIAYTWLDAIVGELKDRFLTAPEVIDPTTKVGGLVMSKPGGDV